MIKDTLQSLRNCVQVLRRERFSGMSLKFRFGIAVERVLKAADSCHMTSITLFRPPHTKTANSDARCRMHWPPLQEFDRPLEEALAASGLS